MLQPSKCHSRAPTAQTIPSLHFLYLIFSGLKSQVSVTKRSITTLYDGELSVLGIDCIAPAIQTMATESASELAN